MAKGVHGRIAAKRDANESEIVEVLTRCGASVVRLNAKGVPDLLVGFDDANYLVEIKARKGKLTGDQVDWHADWRGGRPVILRSIEDAADWITRLRERAS